MSYQCNHLPRIGMDVDIAQHRTLIVSEPDVVEVNLATHLLRRHGVRPLAHSDRLIHELKYSLAPGGGRLELVVELSELTNGLKEARDVSEECHQHTQCDLASHHQRPAIPD